MVGLVRSEGEATLAWVSCTASRGTGQQQADNN